MLGEVVHLVKECEWRKKGAQEGRPRARKKTDLQGKLKLLQGLQHGVEQQIHRRYLTNVHLTITRISSLSALHYERGTWQNSVHLTGLAWCRHHAARETRKEQNDRQVHLVEWRSLRCWVERPWHVERLG
jgi:hypothetical protein